MKLSRFFTGYLALFTLFSMGCATSSPGEGPTTPAAPRALAGTSWEIQIIDPPENERFVLTFVTDGVLRSNHPRDTTPDNDRWTATEDGVSFSFNDGYARYNARFTAEGTMEGEASNVTDAHWRFVLTPQP